MILHRASTTLLTLSVLTACSPPSTDGAPGEGEPDLPDEPPRVDPRVVASRIGAIVDSGRVSLPTGATIPVDARSDSFYTARRGEPLWLERGRAGRLLDGLDGLETEGLEISLGDATAPATLEEGLEAGRVGSLARTDLLLTEAFLAAATALLRGSEDPAAAGVEWRMPRDPKPGVAVLEEVAEGTEPSWILERFRPPLPLYGRMVEALGRYREASARGGWPRVPDGETVEVGDTAARVATVRRRMSSGVDPFERRRARAGEAEPWVFDPSLARAVEHFQRRHGLAVDGVVGPETLEALNVPAAERVETLEANLERLRWMPLDLGSRAVLVNVAGFELVALEESRTALAMDVVVGQPAWRTRIFADTMTHLIVNPYWHIPESIEAREILPAVLDDRSYLEEERLDLVPEDAPFGDPVDPGTVDWSQVTVDDFPWDFCQRPGPENSLGRVKFMFLNRYAIYLHDTPADRLFDRSVRAFSHGCMRVERPWDLARWVLGGAADRPAADVRRLRDTDERIRVDLDRSVPVYVVYLTAWVDP